MAKRKRILFCSCLLTGLDGLMYEGLTEEVGLPSQTKVIQGLIEAGFEVHVLNGMRAEKSLNCNCEWLNRAAELETYPVSSPLRQNHSRRNVYLRYNWQRLLRKRFRKKLDAEGYDCVYLSGNLVSFLAPIAMSSGVPCCQRVYGCSALHPYREHGKYRLWWDELRDPHPFNSLKLKKDVVIATKDGSDVTSFAHWLCGEELPYELLDWTNGVDFPTDEAVEYWDGLRRESAYIFLGARIDYGKGHFFALDTMERLLESGVSDVELVFAGDVSNCRFKEKLYRAIEERGLGEHVNHIGAIARSEVAKYQHLAVASFFTYGTMNRGNSFLEGMAAGMCPILLDVDTSVRDLVVEAETGFFVSDPSEAAKVIMRLLSNASLQRNVKKATRSVAIRSIPTWDERIAQEIGVIENCIQCAGGDKGE